MYSVYFYIESLSKFLINPTVTEWEKTLDPWVSTFPNNIEWPQQSLKHCFLNPGKI